MSGKGAPELTVKNCGDLRVAVIAAQWHEKVMDGLVDGALRALHELGIDEPTLLRVPGSFELPVVAKVLAGRGYDAIVALGVVIRGGTPHFEYVCQGVTQGLTQVSVDTGVPVGFGVLTCDTEEQALDRAGLEGSNEDKGHEAVTAAVATADAAHCAQYVDDPGAERAGARGDPPYASGTATHHGQEDIRGALHRAPAQGRQRRPRHLPHRRTGRQGCACHRQEGRRGGRRGLDGRRVRGQGRAAEEISQLLYHVQVMMVARGISLDDVYAHL